MAVLSAAPIACAQPTLTNCSALAPRWNPLVSWEMPVSASACRVTANTEAHMGSDRGKKTRHEGVFRKKNGAWFIQAVIRDGSSFRSVERTLPKTMSESEVVEARAKLRVELESARATGTQVQTSTPTAREALAAARPTTVADYAEQWLRRKQADWRPKTRADNMEVLASRVLPVLGHIAVGELKRSHIIEWRTWAEGQKTEKGEQYAAGTLALWWRVLRGMLGEMIGDHELSTNLVFKVKAPRSSKPRVRAEAALTIDELAALLAAVKQHHPAFWTEVYILAFSGCRPSELYSLVWSDIELSTGRIIISKSVVHGHVGKPKNGRSRIVALTDGMRAALEAHKAPDQNPEALVFPSDKGTFRSDTTLHHVLRDCGQHTGITVNVGPQILRYTANTLLREAGVADEIVRDRLGHTTREMGHRYFKGHVEAQKAAVERLQAAVDGDR